MQEMRQKFIWGAVILSYAVFLLIGVVLFSDVSTLRPLRAKLFQIVSNDRKDFGREPNTDSYIRLVKVEGDSDFLVRSERSIVFERTFEGERLQAGDVLYTQAGTRVVLEIPGAAEQVVIEENSVVVLDDFGEGSEIQLSFLSGKWRMIDQGAPRLGGGRSIASTTKKLKPKYVAEPEVGEKPEPVLFQTIPENVPTVLGGQAKDKFFFQDEASLQEMNEANNYFNKMKGLIQELQKAEELELEIEARKQMAPILAKKRRSNSIAMDDLFMRETIYIRNVMKRKMGRSPASDITLSIALYEASTGRNGYRFNKAMELALDAYLRKYLIQGQCSFAGELFANASDALSKIESDAPGLDQWKQKWKLILEGKNCI